MRSSWTGATSAPGTAASSRVRRAGRTSRRRRSAARVERASATGCSSGTTATRSSAPAFSRARSAARSGPTIERELGDELGHVKADLQVAGGHVAVARVEQHDLAVVGEQDAVRGQRRGA